MPSPDQPIGPEPLTQSVRTETGVDEGDAACRIPPEALPLPIAIVRRRDGRILAANELLGRMLGLPPGQLTHHALQDFCVHPADRDTLLEDFHKEQIRSRYEVCAVTAGSIPLWVEVSLKPLSFQEEDAVLIAFHDLAEQKSLERELHQIKKMDVVGRLTSGIAHDFNNLLTVIVGWNDIALARLDRTDPLYEQLEEVRKAAHLAGALTQQLLSFSRRDEKRPQVLDLNRIVAAMDTMLQRLIGEDVQLDTALSPEPVYVKANPSQVEQIVMNLAVNARDAMPQGGTLSMKTARADITTAHIHGQAIQPGPYVFLTVTDTGCGMDRGTQARIFDPFYTTKEPGKGTGLGLSTVSGIVKELGGLIAVQSEPGLGTTFTIYLPLADATARSAHAAAPPAPPPRGTETILLVEDDPGIRRLIRETLQMSGYTVLEARHGIEAWVVGNHHAGPIHLLITDVVMPQMSGRALADRLLSARPNMRVLYISGYASDAVFHHGVVDLGQGFLQKPFDPRRLAQKVRELLDASPTR
ncbi:MAG: response regulator [Nitrospirota bacterium]|nr:response regulator [Nitrospirota bacterium]